MKFSSKTQEKPKDDADDEASPGASASPAANGVNGHDADEHVDAPVKQEPTPASSSKKRPAAKNDNVNGESDAEEPPTKKQRGRPKKGVATKTASPKAVVKAEPKRTA